MPCFVRWPGRVPAGTVCDEMCLSMDLYPTFARLAGANVPKDRIIDGANIWPLLSGHPGAKSPHEAFFYYFTGQIQAVRSGRWKLYLPLEAKIVRGGRPPVSFAGELYDLAADPAEEQNLLDQHPEVVSRLSALAQAAENDIGGHETSRHRRAPRRLGR